MKKRNRIRQRGRKKDAVLKHRRSKLMTNQPKNARRSIRLGGFREMGNAATGLLAALAAKARA